MTNEIARLKAELAGLRRDVEGVRAHFPDAPAQGDLATARVTFMNRIPVLSRSDHAMYTPKGRSLRSERR